MFNFISILFLSFLNLHSFDYQLELDPYYSNFGIYKEFKGEIVYLGKKDEFEIYRYLLKNIYKPKSIVFEFSFNPLPYLGTFIKRNYYEFYTKTQVSDNLNLVRAVTSGFEEPWAFSVFLGNVVEFDSIKKSYLGKRKGYSGLLFDFGDYHIRDNTLIYDKWVNIEVKLKGEQVIEERTLLWSFRFGVKFHERDFIKDSFFVGVKRKRTDYKYTGMWYENCGIEFVSSFDINNFDLINTMLLIEKKFPSKSKRFAFSIGTGFVWDSNKRYSNIKVDKNSDNFQFIIRPNIEF